ncbi:MAG: tetratricopeptide repeat protein [FCB group bacterium]|nr:tetratricopeptide repeat protein [FCB group bacterium]
MFDDANTTQSHLEQVREIDGVKPVDSRRECSDWSETISKLMSLAKTANESCEYEQAIGYLDNLEELWNSKGLPGFSMELRFELHREKGKALASQGKHDLAIGEYQKILIHCRDACYLSVKSETFAQIGQLLAKQGDYDRALGYVQRAIGAYRRQHDNLGLCKALRNLGVIYLELGEFEEAEINYNEAIDIAREIGNEVLYADLVNNLGAIMNMKGSWRKALELYRISLKIYEEKEQIRKSAYAKNNLAITLAEQGINEEAFDYFQEAYKTAIAIKDASLTLIVDINLADLFLKKRAMANAKLHCLKAERYLVQAGLTNGHLVEVKKIAGKIAVFEKNFDDAGHLFGEALDVSQQIGARFLEAEVLQERGTLYKSRKMHFEALNDLESSYHIYAGMKAEGKREQIERVINSIERLYLDIFNAMAREVDQKDPYTKGHSDRVASLALLLGRELGLRTSMLKTIVAAALLHDIGKTQVDDSILNKPGRLTDEEFRHIKKHPATGVDLMHGKDLPWDVDPLILHHHEKLDGSGYPLGLKGEDIPLGAKIICISDVFDALTSDRIYRAAFDVDSTLEMMVRDSGVAFDPVILKCFTDMIRAGKADPVINARTSEDELYGIWSQCMVEEKKQAARQAEEVVLN